MLALKLLKIHLNLLVVQIYVLASGLCARGGFIEKTSILVIPDALKREFFNFDDSAWR